MSVLLRPYLPPAITLTTACYRHISDQETKVLIVLFSALVIALDDPKVFDASGSRDLHRRLCNGDFHQIGGSRGVLGMLMDVLSRVDQVYPEFSTSAIISSVLGFVNGCILEGVQIDGVAAHQLDALPFLAYRRSMSGLADAFAYFIWTKADCRDVALYVQAIPTDLVFFSDILSFYKEELAGETGNYVSDRSKACGRSREETLQEIVDETVVLVTRIRGILGDGPVRDAWESFAKGWLTFHLCSPRYRLKELIDCEYVVVDGLGS
ncbi:Trichodiene synthase-domain-containing protein [Fomitopsis serialis]|uniref:Trichodiene synthase-domain-containing protein n=1 Tax=Fomitopsis serialis TaxID=139415 RepID=UPI002007A3AA|nr:Trichodiene synthase-domain-containing protein [Neoantrodia serialis]KAH9934269.1 Trichodiene synthase-domain-containing protein [Neoantrodia serialis]